MFPILPILILLLLGPANAERLAAEGRLPAALLAVHLAHSAPMRAAFAAPAESPKRPASTTAAKPLRVERVAFREPVAHTVVWSPSGCPPRAGPSVA